MSALIQPAHIRPARRLLQQGAESRSAARLRALVGALPAGVIVIDPSGVVTDANPAALRLLGSPLCGEAWREVIARAFASPSHGDELELSDGRRVTLSTCPLGSEPGQIVLLHDVTETYRLRKSLEHARRLTDLGRTAANIAHQVRTPLTSALIYVSQLKRPVLDDERRLELAERATGRLKELERLVSNMLAFSRGDVGCMEVLDPAALLQSALASAGDEREGRNARLEVRSGEMRVVGNRDLLKSALSNLITNALQATCLGGEILLSTRIGAAGAVEFVVADDGPGVPADLAEQIFEPFFTSRPHGTGLGLSVARAVARSHDGELYLEPAGKGACFVLALPALDAPGGAAR